MYQWVFQVGGIGSHFTWCVSALRLSHCWNSQRQHDMCSGTHQHKKQIADDQWSPCNFIFDYLDVFKSVENIFSSLPCMSLSSCVSHLQVEGQCQCKVAVTGRQCADCLSGWYGLQASNPNGCIRCNCSEIGVISSSTISSCNQDTGQCQCKPHVTGKQTKSSHKHAHPHIKKLGAEQ